MQPAIKSHPIVSDTSRLAGVVSQIVRSDCDLLTAVPGLSLHRRKCSTAPVHCIYGLGIGVTLQGCKQVMVGEEVLSYAPGQSMVTSVDLPVISHVTQASVAQPFLGMMLTFDSATVIQLAERMRLSQRMKDEGSGQSPYRRWTPRCLMHWGVWSDCSANPNYLKPLRR